MNKNPNIFDVNIETKKNNLIGDLNDLTTTAKDNLVAAINEVNAKQGGGGGTCSCQIATNDEIDSMF